MAIAPSDIALIVDLGLAVVFVLVFALGKPRVWFRDQLGWVIFYYALAVVALLFLIVWAIIFGQRLDEIYRFVIATALGFALIWKTYQIIRERYLGRKAAARTDERTPPRD